MATTARAVPRRSYLAWLAHTRTRLDSPPQVLVPPAPRAQLAPPAHQHPLRARPAPARRRQANPFVQSASVASIRTRAAPLRAKSAAAATSACLARPPRSRALRAATRMPLVSAAPHSAPFVHLARLAAPGQSHRHHAAREATLPKLARHDAHSVHLVHIRTSITQPTASSATPATFAHSAQAYG